MIYLLIIYALLAGMALPTQFSINAQLKSVVGSPVVASTISFITGAVALFIISLFGQGIKISKEWMETPWWIWTGGLLGAFYVVATVILIPKIGATSTVVYILAGQVLASVLIDHFGLLNVQIHTINLPRLMGITLVICGMIIVQRY
ncbi:DMT family transporter [Rummeliibacillus sp. SL167]|uniref:DMT family transporter n=1 Tax=Rummeliibacillus sp. SL167 TaxID=2579792 RepID=UPI0011B8148C|nr:DMT family transporter [Rummeliibacillus sp. SL167]